MADLATLERALRNADAAGDTQAARTLAGEIIRLRGEGSSTAMDIAKSGASGAARGSADLVGLPGSLGDMAGDAIGGLIQKVTGYEMPKLPRSQFGGEAMKGYMSSATGGASDYQPKTVPGQFARTVGEFLPGAVAFGGASPSSIAKFGIAPALTSEAAGQATKGSDYEGLARFAGAMAAPGLIAAGKKAITPFGIDPRRKAMIDALEREGVKLTAGQKTGNRRLKYRESELGAGSYENFLAKQGDDYTAAVLRKIGVNSNEASPEVVDDAFKSIGKMFNDAAARNSMAVDRTLTDGLQKASAKYLSVTGQMNAAPIVGEKIKELARVTKNGVVSGDVYKNMRTELADTAYSIRHSDSNLARALDDMVESLDDAMERSIAATNPSDIGVFKEARRLYSNLIPIQKAVSGAGEAAAFGQITPPKLRAAIASGTTNQRRYARGKGDLAELARAGNATMLGMPDSGTASRINALLTGGGGAVGAGVGAFLGGGPLGTMGGAVAGSAAPYLLGKAIMSRPGQAYLANDIVKSRPFDKESALMLAAALGRLSGQ